MRRLILLCVFVFVLFSTSYTVGATSQKRAIVLMGQSNAREMYPALKEMLIHSNILILPCFKGGEPIDYFVKGNIMYASCMDKIIKAKKQGYNVVSVFYNQGEADAHNYILAEAWSRKFVVLMSDLKLDCKCKPVIIFARLHISYTGKTWIYLRNEQTKLSIKHPEYLLLSVDSLNMTCSPHFCGEYQEMAVMFLNKLFKIERSFGRK